LKEIKVQHVNISQSRRLPVSDPKEVTTGEGRGLAAVLSHSMRLVALDLETPEDPEEGEEEEEEEEDDKQQEEGEGRNSGLVDEDEDDDE